MSGTTVIGDGLVAVWHSDPTYGDPKEGVFYLEPPYTDTQREQVTRLKTQTWMDRMSERAKLTTKIVCRGPLNFNHPDRHDMGTERAGMDEYVLAAWWRPFQPEILPTDEIDRRRQLAERYGIQPSEPIRWDKGEPDAGVALPFADEYGPYVDPEGRDEAGVLPIYQDQGESP